MLKAKKYIQKFKDLAIQLALTNGYSINKIAKDLGIHDKILYYNALNLKTIGEIIFEKIML